MVKLVMKMLKNIDKITTKHYVLAVVYTILIAGSVTLGLMARAHSSAAVIRDNDSVNSIDGCNINGGIGAADAVELIKDIKDNCNKDLGTIYSHFGLTPDKYTKFQSEAQPGLLWRDGHVEVNGQTVMTDALTLGRTSMGKPASVRKPINIGGTTYYQSTPAVSFAASRQNLPVMVLFDDQGVARTVIMNPCGNPVEGNPKTPKAACNLLEQTQPDKATKPNTYRYTTKATFSDNASLSRVVYHFSDDNTTIEKKSLTDTVEHTFTKDGTVTVTVYAKVPGGKEIKAVAIADCTKKVTYVKPFYVCTGLIPATIDQQQKSFRFTVKAKMDATTTLKSVDFILDNKATSTDVTTKDKDGNIYKEYTFTDDVKHTIKVKLFFNTYEGVQSTECEASVTPKKTPVCEMPGKGHLPPNHPDCAYCKPGIPVGDEKCKEVPPTPPVMPDTGAGNVIGIFVGTTVAGFVGHKVVSGRRSRRTDNAVL